MIKKVLAILSGVFFSAIAWHFVAQRGAVPQASESRILAAPGLSQHDEIGIGKSINDGLPFDAIRTRYGVFQAVSSPQMKLTGRVFSDASEIVSADNSQIDVQRKFEIGDADLILVGETNGTSCPMLFHFFAVTHDSVSSTDEFGTCSDSVSVSLQGDTLVLTMPVIAGMNVNGDSQEKPETRTYRIKDVHGRLILAHG